MSLDMPETSVRGFSPVVFALKSSLYPMRKHYRAFAYTAPTHIRSICYTRTTQNEDTLHLVALGEFGNYSPKTEIYREKLLSSVCAWAVREGKQKVVAKVAEDDPLVEVLVSLGFTRVTEEKVFSREIFNAGSGPATPETSLAEQDIWDAWRLYNHTEPATIRRADGLTPSMWKRNHTEKTQRKEWIVRNPEGNLAVYGSLKSGKRNYILNFFYDPDIPELEQSLRLALNLGINKISQIGHVQVYCTVREHQDELECLLNDEGFSLLHNQLRLVLYTTAFVKSKDNQTVPSVETNPAALQTGFFQKKDTTQKDAII